jgi:hypothetical protein
MLMQGLTAEVLSFNGETLSFGYSSIAITFAPAGDITARLDFQVGQGRGRSHVAMMGEGFLELGVGKGA